MQYDVVIVGGRVAGASLAAHLGKQNQKVLVLDRASFPSLPTVPSSPMLHPGGMKLLDELGIPEASYGRVGDRIPGLRFDVDGYFTSTFHFPTAHGRNYSYGLDRKQFDLVLWENLAQFTSVTRMEGFVVTGLGDGSVTGHDREGKEQTFHAPWIIGADGRYSTIAKLAGAKFKDDRPDHTSTVYYANWKDWAGGPEMRVISNGDGVTIMMYPAPGGLMNVNVQQRSDRAIVEDAQTYYKTTLDSIAAARECLKDATQVLCNELEIQPSVFYYWQAQRFGNAERRFHAEKRADSRESFERQRGDVGEEAGQERLCDRRDQRGVRSAKKRS